MTLNTRAGSLFLVFLEKWMLEELLGTETLARVFAYEPLDEVHGLGGELARVRQPLLVDLHC